MKGVLLNMDPQSVTNLVTNVGFPVALCFILLKYVLQNMERQFTQLDATVKELTSAVQDLHIELKQPQVSTEGAQTKKTP